MLYTQSKQSTNLPIITSNEDSYDNHLSHGVLKLHSKLIFGIQLSGL